MPEQLQRVPRPTSTLDLQQENSQVSTPRGINRNNLTLWFSIGALFVSAIAATLELIPFFNGGQRKAIAEAVQAEVTTRVKEVDSRWADRLHYMEYAVAQKDLELRQADISLRQEQLKTQRTEQRKNTAESELVAEQQAIAERQKELQRRILTDFNIERMGTTVDHGFLPGKDFPLYPQRSMPPVGGYRGGGTLPGQTPTDSYDKLGPKK